MADELLHHHAPKDECQSTVVETEDRGLFSYYGKDKEEEKKHGQVLVIDEFVEEKVYIAPKPEYKSSHEELEYCEGGEKKGIKEKIKEKIEDKKVEKEIKKHKHEKELEREAEECEEEKKKREKELKKLEKEPEKEEKERENFYMGSKQFFIIMALYAKKILFLFFVSLFISLPSQARESKFFVPSPSPSTLSASPPISSQLESSGLYRLNVTLQNQGNYTVSAEFESNATKYIIGPGESLTVHIPPEHLLPKFWIKPMSPKIEETLESSPSTNVTKPIAPPKKNDIGVDIYVGGEKFNKVDGQCYCYYDQKICLKCNFGDIKTAMSCTIVHG